MLKSIVYFLAFAIFISALAFAGTAGVPVGSQQDAAPVASGAAPAVDVAGRMAPFASFESNPGFEEKEAAKNNTHPMPAYMKLFPGSASILEGQSVQYMAVLYSASGVPLVSVPPSSVSWSVSGDVGGMEPSGVFRATSPGHGAVRGIYGYGPAHTSFVATASIIVSSVAPPPPPANTSTYLEMSPPSASLLVGETQQFNAIFHRNGSSVEVPVAWSFQGDAGTVSQSGLFTAISEGSGNVAAIYEDAQSHVGYIAEAPVVVSSAQPQNSTYLELVPSSASLIVGQTQQFSAFLRFGPGGAYSTPIPASEIEWGTSSPPVGTIGSNGLFAAIGNGSAVVSAVYEGNSTPAAYLATANVEVWQATQPSGGNGGGGSGTGGAGGAYKTSTVASFTCAGKSATVKVTYLTSSQLSATVDIYYIGQKNAKIASKVLEGTGSFDFTPEKEGRYEVRVSLGVDQSSAYFTVPSCTAGQPQPEQNVTVSLRPNSERVLSKTVDYQNGFSKSFEVWRATDASGTDRYSTDITLAYVGKSTLYNATVQDRLPKSVVASASQVAFEKRPTRIGSDSDSLEFGWSVRSIVKNERLTYKYSFARPLTEQMIDSFPAPLLIAGPAPLPAQEGDGGIGSMIAASIGALSGAALWIVLLAFLASAAAVYLFVFGKKKE